MNHEMFRLLIFEVLNHHLDELCELSTDHQYYHVERCRWAVEYLKRYTVATEQPTNPQLEIKDDQLSVKYQDDVLDSLLNPLPFEK